MKNIIILLLTLGISGQLEFHHRADMYNYLGVVGRLSKLCIKYCEDFCKLYDNQDSDFCCMYNPEYAKEKNKEFLNICDDECILVCDFRFNVKYNRWYDDDEELILGNETVKVC